MSRKPIDMARVQAGYYALTGLWPLVSIRSFQAITGPKVDLWLVKNVGLLAAVIGGTLGFAAARRRTTPEVDLLGGSAALSFVAIDVNYAARGRISKVYLLDALINLIFLAAWLRAAYQRPSASRPS